MSHIPVLLNEVIRLLDPKPGDFIVDGTLDGGGHAAEIIQRILPGGAFLGVDWDSEIINRAEDKISTISNLKSQILKIRLVCGNYADIPEILRKEKLGQADGLLLDLGFSSDQLENSGRGFSFLKDEPLLMTYAENAKPVRQIIRELGEKELAKIIFELSGEKLAMRIARAIKEGGRKKAIETSGELAGIIRGAVSENYERGRIDPATRTFQALRIYANGELENVRTAIDNLRKVLKPGGRIVIISFHSLEDRIVKQNFKNMEKEGALKIITKKPITASMGEIRVNSRSRSAKLRAAVLRESSI